MGQTCSSFGDALLRFDRFKMAGRWSRVLLRTLDQSLKNSGKGQVTTTTTNVQKRYVGNLPVKPNPYVEDWAMKRENVELTFKFDNKTLAVLATAGVLTPYLIYQMCISEFQSMQEIDGRAKKKYWGRDN